ncbi:hypothetical protein B7755_020910 [Streptomyces sp. NBS 14/10]|uniref:hypothetical protein n=1 Tax=Streptomyces sp. NBS 14/10 TaxID=1945643 RepID=UPI000B7DCC21|nr:hypothetical protein [Streptomyces sp. NBS 14/10]KAK1180388.1 hypothetical protein B7755_020910 [Streptomyces sp. NBS 14/10]
MTVSNPTPELTRRRAPRRALTAALVLTIAATAATACDAVSNEPKRYSQACGVVVDGSGSAAANKTGFDAEAKLKATLNTFLSDNKCRKTSFAPITKVSQASKCQVSPLDLDPDTSKTADRDRTRKAMRAVALSSALKLLRCAQDEEPGSDVLGGLSRIALTKTSGGGDDDSFDVLVVSDFDQGDPDFRLGRQDLSTAASRAKTIDAFLKSHHEPELSGADIYPVGYGMKYHTDTSRYDQFNSFWTELLEGRVKAHVHTTYR